MSSRFNFGRMAAAWPGIKQRAMQQLAEKTRDYFVASFDNEAWGKQAWHPVKRPVPPPPLNVTGQLKQKTKDSIQSVTSFRIVMINFAVDDRGRRYSWWQNEGTPNMPQRSFMKQTDELTKIQLDILKKETGKVWSIG